MQRAESDGSRIKRQDKRNLNRSGNDNVYPEFCTGECLTIVMQLKSGLSSAWRELKKKKKEKEKVMDQAFVTL